MKRKIDIISQTADNNKNDTLRTQLEKLEYFVVTIENVDLSETPEEFNVAYKNYCNEFRKTLELSKETNKLYLENDKKIQQASDSLMSIYSNY